MAPAHSSVLDERRRSPLDRQRVEPVDQRARRRHRDATVRQPDPRQAAQERSATPRGSPCARGSRRDRWGRKPNARCSLGSRSTRKRCGSSKTLVAVRGRVDHHHRVAGADGATTERRVVQRHATHGAHGRGPAHDLVGRRGPQRLVGGEARTPSGCSNSASMPCAIALRVVSLPATSRNSAKSRISSPSRCRRASPSSTPGSGTDDEAQHVVARFAPAALHGPRRGSRGSRS